MFFFNLLSTGTYLGYFRVGSGTARKEKSGSGQSFRFVNCIYLIFYCTIELTDSLATTEQMHQFVMKDYMVAALHQRTKYQEFILAKYRTENLSWHDCTIALLVLILLPSII